MRVRWVGVERRRDEARLTSVNKYYKETWLEWARGVGWAVS
jgi:hypothetical protein